MLYILTPTLGIGLVRIVGFQAAPTIGAGLPKGPSSHRRKVAGRYK